MNDPSEHFDDDYELSSMHCRWTFELMDIEQSSGRRCCRAHIMNQKLILSFWFRFFFTHLLTCCHTKALLVLNHLLSYESTQKLLGIETLGLENL